MSRQDKNKETTGDTNTALVSITDLLNTPQEVDDGDTIETLRIGGEAAFVAFFTDQAVPVSAHWLDATDT